MAILSPSILSADYVNLEQDLKATVASGVKWLHVDNMDGNFVPNISFGPSIIKSIKPLTIIPFDVHLMIENPDKYLNVFKDSGADILTYHYETNLDHHKMIV